RCSAAIPYLISAFSMSSDGSSRNRLSDAQSLPLLLLLAMISPLTAWLSCDYIFCSVNVHDKEFPTRRARVQKLKLNCKTTRPRKETTCSQDKALFLPCTVLRTRSAA